MRVVQIHDKTQDGHALAFDLRDVLAALGHRVLRAYWSVSGLDSHGEDLAATGAGAAALEDLARSGARVSGSRLVGVARQVHQVIWGEFRGYDDERSGDAWITIVAFDSSWFEIRSDDVAVFMRIQKAFKDVRSPQQS